MNKTQLTPPISANVRENYSSLDGLRAYAAIGIVLMHVLANFMIKRSDNILTGSLWCLLSDGAACRMDYPEVGLQEGSDNRTGSLRYRCSDVHTGKQDQQFLLLRSVAVCDRMRTDLSGNECESLYYGTGTS